MPEQPTRTINVFRVDGEPVSGWRRKGSYWLSFSIDNGEETDAINCGQDEERARDYAKITANMRAGGQGRITLNDEDDGK